MRTLNLGPIFGNLVRANAGPFGSAAVIGKAEEREALERTILVRRSKSPTADEPQEAAVAVDSQSRESFVTTAAALAAEPAAQLSSRRCCVNNSGLLEAGALRHESIVRGQVKRTVAAVVAMGESQEDTNDLGE